LSALIGTLTFNNFKFNTRNFIYRDAVSLYRMDEIIDLFEFKRKSATNFKITFTVKSPNESEEVDPTKIDADEECQISYRDRLLSIIYGLLKDKSYHDNDVQARLYLM